MCSTASSMSSMRAAVGAREAPATNPMSPSQYRSPILQLPVIRPCVRLATVGPGRDFAFTLQQTKIVYDQLLNTKYARLMEPLHRKKQQFDEKCQELEDKEAINEALQYGVKAQEYLNRQHAEIQAEVFALQQDYQHKLDSMYNKLEDNWRRKGCTA